MIRAEYTVEKLPDTFVRESISYKPVFVVDDEGNFARRPDGRKQFSHWETIVEKKYGGYKYTFPRGHSVVLDTPPETETTKRVLGQTTRQYGNQLELFSLNKQPRLIDDQTGEEVDERGVPLHIAHLVAQPGQVSGAQATDLDGEGAISAMDKELE